MGNHDRQRVEGLGSRIRELRHERGLSQDRVSISSGIDQSGYSKFERGLRNLKQQDLHRIAEALGMSFEEMV